MKLRERLFVVKHQMVEQPVRPTSSQTRPERECPLCQCSGGRLSQRLQRIVDLRTFINMQ